MGEQSHVDAMRAAIRGDFERLEQRRGAQELMRVSEPVSDDERGGERREEQHAEPSPPASRGWLDRLRGR